MLKKITVGLLLVACITSCKSKKAYTYSQDFVKKENSLLPHINSTEENVKRYVDNLQFDSIGIAGKKMEQLVEDKIKEIRNTPAPDAKGGDEFKEAGIKYFGFIKSMYTAYANFGSAGSDEQREIERQKLFELVGKKNESIKAMQDAQQKFADANGFKLERTK